MGIKSTNMGQFLKNSIGVSNAEFNADFESVEKIAKNFHAKK